MGKLALPSRIKAIACLAAAVLMAHPRAGAQTMSKAEKLEGKLRVAILKATKGIDAPLIMATELKRIIDDTNLVLIDVRQPKEQEISMLPRALTTTGFAERFRRGIPAGKRLVVYCTIGYRSGKYAMELARQGIRAENLEGGVLAWSFAGGEFLAKDPSGALVPTVRVHVYDPEWNILHPDYRAVW